MLTVRAWVESGGVLEYLPEPMVVADGARHFTDIRIDLAPGAALVLRDEIILGRHAERGGYCRTRLRVDYGGMPLLRHDVAVDGTDEVSLGPALLAGHRAHGTLLHAGAAGEMEEPDEAMGVSRAGGSNEMVVASGMPKGAAEATAPGAGGVTALVGARSRGTVAAMPLAGPGVLVSALAPDSLSLRRLLDAAAAFEG